MIRASAPARTSSVAFKAPWFEITNALLLRAAKTKGMVARCCQMIQRRPKRSALSPVQQ
jgi:hypothetical protein